MASDAERIAEVIAGHPGGVILLDDGWHPDCECWGGVGRKAYPNVGEANQAYHAHVAEHLAAAGFGHVPTALHQAADAMPIETLLGADKASVWLRDRAEHPRYPFDGRLVAGIDPHRSEKAMSDRLSAAVAATQHFGARARAVLAALEEQP